jgi:hypothetical protein
MNIDFNSIESIKNAGCLGFRKISDLWLDNSLIPSRKGVYFVLYTPQKEPGFLTVGTGGHFKGRNPNVLVSMLKNNWVEDTLVIYIGQAGGGASSATLRSRIRQYLRFGQGNDVGHYGGRLIWQISDSTDLLFCWKPLTNQNPREIEKELIREFVLKYGKMPFANLRT